MGYPSKVTRLMTYLKSRPRYIYNGWPECAILGVFAYVGGAIQLYRYRDELKWKSHYVENYTVYRPSDPRVPHMRLPAEYPPMWVAQRDNAHYNHYLAEGTQCR